MPDIGTRLHYQRAPLNYFNLLLNKNPVPDIRDSWNAAVRSFRHRLWYFSEHLAPLALFDDVSMRK